MSYNIINASTGETTSFDGRGVSFMSDSYSSAAAGQTKTINLTTMANQYIDAKKVCRPTLYTKVNVKGDFTADYTGKIVAEDVSSGAETVVLDLATVSNVADVNQDILLDLHIAADHYLKVKDAVFTAGEVHDVKLVFDITPINSAADEAAARTKQGEMYAFYGTTGPMAENQRIRVEVSMDAANPWVDAKGLEFTAPGDARYHWGFLPCDIQLTGTDGSVVTAGFGGSDSRRYLSNVSTTTYSKHMYVKPNIAYTMEPIRASVDLTAFPSDKEWHPALNYSKVKVSIYKGDELIPIAKDITSGGYVPDVSFDEVAYATHAAQSSTSFVFTADGVRYYSYETYGSKLDASYIMGWLATALGVNESDLSTDTSAWTINQNGWGTPGYATNPSGNVTTSAITIQGDMPTYDLTGKYRSWYDFMSPQITNIQTVNMTEMPALPVPDMPASLDGDVSIVDGSFDAATRTLTLNVNSTMSSNIDLKLGFHAYGDEDVYMQTSRNNAYDSMKPYYTPYSGFYEPGGYYRNYDSSQQLSAISDPSIPTGSNYYWPNDYMHFPGPDGQNVCAQFFYSADSSSSGFSMKELTVVPGTHQHTVDLSAMNRTGVNVAAILDAPFTRDHGSTSIGNLDVLGPDGAINDYINNNVIFFDDDTSNVLTYKGVSYPNRPWKDVVVLEQNTNPFGMTVTFGNPSLVGDFEARDDMASAICSTSVSETALKSQWWDKKQASIGPVSGTFEGNTYYLNHMISSVNNFDALPTAHATGVTPCVPYSGLKSGEVYCVPLNLASTAEEVMSIFGGNKYNDISYVRQERMAFFRVPAIASGSDNLKVTIAMTGMATGLSATGKPVLADEGFKALKKIFPIANYLEAESTYDSNTNTGTMVYHCPGADASVLPDGTYPAPSGSLEQPAASWAVSSQVVTIPENLANYVAKLDMNVDNYATVRSDPDGEWIEYGNNKAAAKIERMLAVLGGLQGVKVTLTPGEEDVETRMRINDSFDIEFYADSEANALARVNTDVYEGVYSAAALNDIKLTGFSATTTNITSVHAIGSPEASRPPWNLNNEPMYRYLLEFNSVTSRSLYNPWNQMNKDFHFLTDEMERYGLVNLGFSRFNLINGGAGSSPVLECSATAANMQRALDEFAFTDGGAHFTSEYMRILKATNITDQAKYKLTLNPGVWFGNPNYLRDPKHLASAHKAWGIDAILPTIKAALYERGAARGSVSYSNLVHNQGTDPYRNQYRFDLEFTMSSACANVLATKSFTFGLEGDNNTAPTNSLTNKTDSWAAGSFESTDFTVTKLSDEAALTAAPVAVLNTTAVFPPDAVANVYAHADGDLVTVSGAFTKTDGNVSATVNNDALICYVPLGGIADTAGLTTLVVDARLTQGVTGNATGITVNSDFELLVHGQKVYVKLGDTTGVSQLTDLSGSAGTQFAYVNSADGAPVAPGVRTVTVNVARKWGYPAGWTFNESDGYNHLKIRDATSNVELFSLTDELLAVSKEYDGGDDYTMFLMPGDYEIQGICNSEPAQGRFSVIINGITVVPATSATNLASATWLPFSTPDEFTVTAYDSFGDGWNGTGPSLTITDSSNVEVFSMTTSTLESADAAGSSETWYAMPGTYSVLATNVVDPQQSSYKIFDVSGTEIHSGTSAAPPGAATSLTIA